MREINQNCSTAITAFCPQPGMAFFYKERTNHTHSSSNSPLLSSCQPPTAKTSPTQKTNVNIVLIAKSHLSISNTSPFLSCFLELAKNSSHYFDFTVSFLWSLCFLIKT
ncbi:hypothetical protein ILYODFUR_026249 [Ilyodon furcidens]|uniref:Uncharacterized protein n=1 Tax=Ilyodon furcidens TaxID=33524 RepID=A0ABV0UBA2_9TELE